MARKKRRENTLIRNREFRKRVRLRYVCRICGYKNSHHALQFDNITGVTRSTRVLYG